MTIDVVGGGVLYMGHSFHSQKHINTVGLDCCAVADWLAGCICECIPPFTIATASSVHCRCRPAGNDQKPSNTYMVAICSTTDAFRGRWSRSGAGGGYH